MRSLDKLPDENVRLWEPDGSYVECIADRQSMNGRVGVDFTTWYREGEIAAPVYGIEPMIMSANQVKAAKAAIDSGNPNPNHLLIAPFCLSCGCEPAVWTVDFFLEPFFAWLDGKRVMIDRLGFGENCISDAAALVAKEKERLEKMELVG